MGFFEPKLNAIRSLQNAMCNAAAYIFMTVDENTPCGARSCSKLDVVEVVLDARPVAASTASTAATSHAAAPSPPRKWSSTTQGVRHPDADMPAEEAIATAKAEGLPLVRSKEGSASGYRGVYFRASVPIYRS